MKKLQTRQPIAKSRFEKASPDHTIVAVNRQVLKMMAPPLSRYLKSSTRERYPTIRAIQFA